MNPESSGRIVELFERAADLATEEQAAFLDRECGNDRALRCEIEKLLRADREPEQDILRKRPPRMSTSMRQFSQGETETSQSILLGTAIGSYRITRQIGTGGMGVVYMAQHDELDKRAVVKVLKRKYVQNEEMVQRFKHEARAAASIRHPGIVDVIDVGRHDSGDLFILMEYLEGETLKSRLHRIPQLPQTLALSFVRQALRALAAVHDMGIVHRDLKPENIFLIGDADVAHGERVKLLDFGIAKLQQRLDERITQVGMIMGTPPYMAPEQWVPLSEIDHRVDLYALGVIFFEMLCGRRPFIGKATEQYCAAHLEQSPPSPRQFNRQISPEIAQVVTRLLAKKPDDRFASARALLEELDQIEIELGASPGSELSPVPVPVDCESTGTIALVTAPLLGEVAPATDSQRPAPLDRLRSPDSGPDSAAPIDRNLDDSVRALRSVIRPIRWFLPVSTASALIVVIAAILSITWNERSLSGPSHTVQPVNRPRPTCLADLLREFDRASETKQRNIIEAIRLVGHFGAADVLYRAVRDGTPQVRLVAARALRDLGWNDAAGRIRQSMQTTSGELKVQLAACLVELGDGQGRDILERAVSDNRSKNPSTIQLVAATALARFGLAEPARPILRRVLEVHPRGGHNWLWATSALLALGDKQAGQMLRKELTNASADRQVAAAGILAESHDADAVVALQRMLHDDAFRRRGDAALALARLGHTSGLAYVRRGLGHAEPHERRLAIAVAGRLARSGGRRFETEIREMAEIDPDLEVRETARIALIAFETCWNMKNEHH